MYAKEIEHQMVVGGGVGGVGLQGAGYDVWSKFASGEIGRASCRERV